LLDWLVLRDILNIAHNITSAAYKRWGGWRGWVDRLTLLVNTANQVVCPVHQTDGNSSPETE